MKVILCENVINLGDMGTTVTVTPGYARNFLFPRNLAVSADSASAKQLEHTMRGIRKREEKHKGVLRDLAKQLEGAALEFVVRAGAEDKLFGSVTNANIADKLEELGHKLDRRMIAMHEPIKTLGTHKVAVKLGNGVEATLKISVKKLEEEVPAAAKADAVEESEASGEEDAD